MKRTLLWLFAALGGVILFTIAALAALNWALFAPAPLADSVVLDVDLDRGLVETLPDEPLLLALESGRVPVRDVVEAITAAENDPRVRGLLVRGGGSLPGWATADEIREAVLRFRRSGKPAVFFAETFGELTPGQLGYHAATAFERIHLQPSGEVGLAPLLMEAYFLRDALDELEIEPQMDRRGEYKDAGEIFTETGFTEPARQARTALLESLEASLTEGMAEGRGISGDSARILLLDGPYMAERARDVGLVDDLLYVDEVRQEFREEWGDETEFVDPGGYLERSGRGWNEGTRVALVYGTGTIYQGRSGLDPLTGSTSMGATTVAETLRRAAEDPRVGAIVFRIDSPGGSWVASDRIRREVARAREGGTPVVVSMGNLAASGGYVVAMDADRIVAHPSTYTGSIGVVAGKLATESFWESIGVDWDRVQTADRDNFFSLIEPFSPEQWERFQLFLDEIYEDFVTAVARARDMEVSEVEAVAGGRVWTGRDAVSLGLVDRLGGLSTALDVARELVGEADDAPLQVAVYPEPRTVLEMLIETGGRSGGAGVLSQYESSDGVAGLLRPIGSLTRLLAEVGLVRAPGPVLAPRWEVPGQ